MASSQHRLHDTAALDIHDGAFAKRIAATWLGPQDHIGRLRVASLGHIGLQFVVFFWWVLLLIEVEYSASGVVIRGAERDCN